jgi:hypothetical protein
LAEEVGELAAGGGLGSGWPRRCVGVGRWAEVRSGDAEGE